ncbi:uncharacterized protein F5891DRAFT_989057 [Suillus fuscotomentosus]|uniref:DUF6532 domain-containing protein n=1 Tax=Suillus fuscotomentosus TaxID=1912939 RepID=A0AAD4DNH1_9AGAM|nr:uncharacterized protein F5891DRAFT_989057 [Suillus fuscotomentosus]KAG1886384.1 hypothetical protein F5891DRAFT_989057 [Suillus fuscotomentosus]
MANRPSQRKGKAAVPKPARGSGLNPSGLPAADQLNIPAEQPSVPAFSFNPHEDSMQWQSGGPDQHSFRGLTHYDDSHASGSTSFGAQFAQPQPSHEDHFTQSQPPHDDTTTSYDGYPYDQDGFGDTGDRPYGGPSFTNPQPNFSYDGSSFTNPQPNLSQPHYDGTSQPNLSQPHYDGMSYDGYPYDQDGFGDTGDQLYDGPSSSNLGTSGGPQEGAHVHGTPLPAWVDKAPDGGAAMIDRGAGFMPPATNLALLWRGEIPREEVVHTKGPAHTTKKRSTRANLPATPYFVPQAPRSTTEPQTRAAVHMTAPQTPVVAEHSTPTLKTVRVSNEDISDAVKGGKVLIGRVMFTKHAMMQKRKKRVAQFEDAIKDSTPRCLEADVVIENFITNAHRRQVSNALSSIRGKIAQFARDGVFVSYKLFPPRGSTIAAAQRHCIAMVNTLIWGIDPLLFMHAYSVDKHGNITIDAKFQNAFIMAGVIRFVWREGREAFLSASPLKAIKYVMASVGSGTHCALQEQRSAVITVDTFGGQHHEEKFKEIVQVFDDLTDEEKLEFESYLQYVLDVGPSQAGNGESSSDSE